jgi:hypothetical protein
MGGGGIEGESRLDRAFDCLLLWTKTCDMHVLAMFFELSQLSRCWPKNDAKAPSCFETYLDARSLCWEHEHFSQCLRKLGTFESCTRHSHLIVSKSNAMLASYATIVCPPFTSSNK